MVMDEGSPAAAWKDLSAAIIEPAVNKFESTLLNLKLLVSLDADYQNEVRALRVDATSGHLSVNRVKQVIGDRYKTLQRQRGQHDTAYITRQDSNRHRRNRGNRGGRGGRGGRSNRGGRGGNRASSPTPSTSSTLSGATTTSTTSSQPSSSSGGTNESTEIACLKKENNKRDRALQEAWRSSRTQGLEELR